MKRTLGLFAAALAIVAFTLPMAAADAQTWKNVSLLDVHCSTKMAAKADEHPRSCALQCAKGGYGVITEDGKYLRFDDAGNEKALAALKASEKKDHLRATVTGSLDGETIKVASLVLAQD